MRIRNTEYETVHHLTSRIAHRARFLEAEEQNDFLSLMLRVSAFSGVEPLGWCVMNNHFHIFVYLPEPPVLSDEEVLARYKLLKGDGARIFGDEDDDLIKNPYGESGAECLTPRASFEDETDGRDEAREKLVRSIRRRMYSIAEYMRMIKKWFSDAYNERNKHKGTMWEAVYGDNSFFLPADVSKYTDLRDILAYIHLNPIRAGLTDRFDGYTWSSYSAYRKGDESARAAMHRAYPELSDEEIVACHEERMAGLLEKWKLRRAEEIARKRLAGYEMPADGVTLECQVAQARERIAEIQKVVTDLQLERAVAKGTKEVREIAFQQIRALVSVYPESTPQSIADALELPLRSVQRYMKLLVERGELDRDDEGWRVLAAA